MQFIPRQLVLVVLLPLLAFLLASCQTSAPSSSTPPSATPSVTPSVTPSAPRIPGPVSAARYRIRSDLSDVRFLVYRAGPLARLGHNHVIQAQNVQGEVQLAADLKTSTFRLTLPIADFRVDNADARRDEGQDFATEPDEEAIAGTRRNMLSDKVLDAAHHPEIFIESTMISGPAWEPDVTLRIRLHGVEREITVPVALNIYSDQIIATAAFSIRQSDFGITPLSVLGGGLQVADTVRVRLRLTATQE